MRFLSVEGDKPTLLNWVASTARKVPCGPAIVELGRSFFGNGGTDTQWQRIVLNSELDSLVHSLHPERLKVLEVSGTRWEKAGFLTYQSVMYPDFDVCQQRLDSRFDLIIAEQVFEHLLWPYRAGRNIFSMLSPSGMFLISTPFMIPIHECPYDCTRWTPTGMKYFLAECGFPIEEIKTGSWGNLKCVKGNLRRWQIYQRWRHSLHNEQRYPLQVWALARKNSCDTERIGGMAT